MKNIKQYIVEAVKDHDKSVIQMLNMFAKSSSGVQQALFKQKIEDADSVDIVSIKDVFTDEEIKEIKKRINPQAKCCYENAWKLCDRFSYEGNHDIKYCEGYLNFQGLPIEHAFNKVDGKYIDITVELALKKELEDTYVTVGEYTTDEVRNILLQNGFYGEIYNTIFLNKYKENIKQTA